MFWQDDEDEIQQIDDGTVVDLICRLQGKTLPVDYSFGLYQAVRDHAPWIEENKLTGVYLITSGEEGNGWVREDDPDEVIYLSRRTRLILRVNKEHVSAATDLVDKTLSISGHPLLVKSIEQQALSQITTMYARHVVLDAEDEEVFLQQVMSTLNQLNIRCKKILCGKTRSLKTDDAHIQTRSLMLADLTREDAIKLQQFGIGPYRSLGCGLFIPHKAIK